MRLSLFLILALISSFAMSQDVVEIVYSDNTALSARKASGTNCNIKAILTRLSAFESSIWKRVKLSVKSGNFQENLFEKTYGDLEHPMQPGVVVNLRFASTKFSDNETLEFKYEGWDFTTDGTGDPTAFIVRTTTVYNKCLAIATNVNEQGEVVPESDTRYPLSIRGVGKKIVEYAMNSSVGPSNSNMRHTVSPATSSAAQSIAEAAVHPLITSSTVIVACVHADPYGFCDSLTHTYTLTPPSMEGYIRTSGVNAEVPALVSAKGSAISPYNMALMWCCDTLRLGGYNESPSSFGLLNKTAAAYLGFADTVAAWLKAGDQTNQMPVNCNDPLDLHAKKVLELLKDGATAKEAVDQANLAYPPRRITRVGQPCPFLPMIIRGDGLSRLYNVYLSQAERDQFPEKVDSWFFVVP